MTRCGRLAWNATLNCRLSSHSAKSSCCLFFTTLWRHQMETFSALLALCAGNSPAGNSPLPVNSPHKGQWRGTLMFYLICAWINDWANNREAGDLWHHRGHYDVNVMKNMMIYISSGILLNLPITEIWKSNVSNRFRCIYELGLISIHTHLYPIVLNI